MAVVLSGGVEVVPPNTEKLDKPETTSTNTSKGPRLIQVTNLRSVIR